SALNVTAFSEKRFRTQLIVLPNCTAKTKPEEAVFNLTSGFTLLGIASVVTSLWNAPDEAAYSQMRTFYKDLASGTPLDVALQHTKLKWLESTPLSSQNPGQWAGLV